MNKFSYLLLALTLTGCAAFENISNPLKSPDNPNCMDMDSFKIAQVLNDGALAYECKNGDCSPFYRWVALKQQLGMDYYDDMIVDVPTGKCAVQDGVYKYQTKDERTKTVPVIDFDYMYKSSSEKESEERFHERLDTLKLRVDNECRGITKDASNGKKCSCFSDTFVEEVVAVGEKEDVSYEKEKLNIIKKVEKKCGKLPKELKEKL